MESNTVKELKERISALENENRLLKERLTKAGVSYADIVEGIAGEIKSDPEPNQGSRIKSFEITDKVANDFFMMFCRGRKDVYDLRYSNPRTG